MIFWWDCFLDMIWLWFSYALGGFQFHICRAFWVAKYGRWAWFVFSNVFVLNILSSWIFFKSKNITMFCSQVRPASGAWRLGSAARLGKLSWADCRGSLAAAVCGNPSLKSNLVCWEKCCEGRRLEWLDDLEIGLLDCRLYDLKSDTPNFTGEPARVRPPQPSVSKSYQNHNEIITQIISKS